MLNPNGPGAGSLSLLNTKSLRESWARVPTTRSPRLLFACKKAPLCSYFLILVPGEPRLRVMGKETGQRLPLGVKQQRGRKSCSSAAASITQTTDPSAPKACFPSRTSLRCAGIGYSLWQQVSLCTCGKASFQVPSNRKQAGTL